MANGGGATHIAKVSGLLSALSSNVGDILIVAGGGGGATSAPSGNGADAGGIAGNGNFSANQTEGYSFGAGEGSIAGVGAGGGGFYGGYKGDVSSGGGGGSGYIGNSSLTEKKMVGYNVPTSSSESTFTDSVNVFSPNPLKNTPKSGNGFARITYLGDVPIEPYIISGLFYSEVTVL